MIYLEPTFKYPDAISENDRGDRVEMLQYFLSLLSEFYFNIPTVQVTGFFGPETKAAIIEFQKAKNLPQTGVVNNVTWNAIYRDFRGIVSTIFEQGLPTNNFLPFRGTPLSLGSAGENVYVLQQYINNIASVYTNISPVNITGIFDQDTMNSVMQYQRAFGLNVTGIVNRVTWNSIGNTYLDVVNSTTPQPTQYPGYDLSM